MLTDFSLQVIGIAEQADRYDLPELDLHPPIIIIPNTSFLLEIGFWNKRSYCYLPPSPNRRGKVTARNREPIPIEDRPKSRGCGGRGARVT